MTADLFANLVADSPRSKDRCDAFDVIVGSQRQHDLPPHPVYSLAEEYRVRETRKQRVTRVTQLSEGTGQEIRGRDLRHLGTTALAFRPC